MLDVITPVSRPRNLAEIYEQLCEIREYEVRWYRIADPACADEARLAAESLSIENVYRRSCTNPFL